MNLVVRQYSSKPNGINTALIYAETPLTTSLVSIPIVRGATYMTVVPSGDTTGIRGVFQLAFP